MTFIRKSNVTFDRWPAFIAAVEKMMQAPAPSGAPDASMYDYLVSIHARPAEPQPGGKWHYFYRMHGSHGGEVGYKRFLPWHRAYLIVFERELRKVDQSLSLPYWDWDNDKGYLHGVENYVARNDKRSPGLRADQVPTGPQDRWFSSQANTQFLENLRRSYYDFTKILETGIPTRKGVIAPHGLGHNWVGGDMATAVSPNDILFWMHHAAIDRIWARWQAKNPGKIAALKGKDAKLDPWDKEFDIHNINDISKLGADSYDYEDPKPVAP